VRRSSCRRLLLCLQCALYDIISERAGEDGLFGDCPMRFVGTVAATRRRLRRCILPFLLPKQRLVLLIAAAAATAAVIVFATSSCLACASSLLRAPAALLGGGGGTTVPAGFQEASSRRRVLRWRGRADGCIGGGRTGLPLRLFAAPLLGALLLVRRRRRRRCSCCRALALAHRILQHLALRNTFPAHHTYFLAAAAAAGGGGLVLSFPLLDAFLGAVSRIGNSFRLLRFLSRLRRRCFACGDAIPLLLGLFGVRGLLRKL